MPRLYNENYSSKSFILSESREGRPSVKTEDTLCICPFCRGNEKMLEHIWLEKSTSDDDLIRIVNNKYPICVPADELYGFHDVVIDTLDHHKKPFQFTILHWQKLIESLKERYAILWSNPRIHMIQIFKNNGCEAGASIAHSHWQIVALEQIPASLLRQYSVAREFYTSEGYCELCSGKRLEAREYTFYETTHWRVVAPIDSCIPHETWLVPKQHVCHFGELTQQQYEDLGVVLSKIVYAQEELLPGVHYNICFMGSILNEFPWYHFHIRLLPRKGQFAGFELATGCYITYVSALEHSVQMRTILNKLEGDENGKS